jgi:hypothetical protein
MHGISVLVRILLAFGYNSQLGDLGGRFVVHACWFERSLDVEVYHVLGKQLLVNGAVGSVATRVEAV